MLLAISPILSWVAIVALLGIVGLITFLGVRAPQAEDKGRPEYPAGDAHSAQVWDFFANKARRWSSRRHYHLED